VARIKGWCRSCHHREWVRQRERYKEPERYVAESPDARRLRLAKDAYACAVSLEARLRTRAELESVLREAAN
jgi:hypothetical protein